MSICIYKINSTGKYGCDVDSRFPGGRRDGYTVIECGLSKTDAEARIKELEAEEKAKEEAKESTGEACRSGTVKNLTVGAIEGKNLNFLRNSCWKKKLPS